MLDTRDLDLPKFLKDVGFGRVKPEYWRLGDRSIALERQANRTRAWQKQGT